MTEAWATLCPHTGVFCSRLDCDPVYNVCVEHGSIDSAKLFGMKSGLKVTATEVRQRESLEAYSRRATGPRCMHDVYLQIEAHIDELEAIARQRAKHSAELKVRLATLEQLRGRVQIARRN